ncbi:MAG: B12-binding domain-containing radical SAM protein [Defluviitaleaceae bacterium]|nr:B12-binding domain-containing radical SAM protein [Defluviitaleaceae bacterium]
MAAVLLLAQKSNINGLNRLYDDNLAEFKSRDRLWSTPHLGLLTVGAMLPKDWDICYVDLNYEGITKRGYDFVFLSPATSQAEEAYAYADSFKKSGAKTIMGGPHVSVLPEEALRHADSVFIGEAEDTAESFISDISRGKIKDVYMSQDKPDLSRSPVPLYNLAGRYPYKSIPVQLSRGCPHQCSFCLSSTIYGCAVRRKPVDSVEKELLYVKTIWKRPFIFFTDDNLLFHEDASAGVFEIMKGLKLEWYGFTDISVYRKEKLLNLLAESGCRKLLIGFESLNAANLHHINKAGWKKSRIEEYRLAIDTIQRRKIGVVGSFILGLAEDDEYTFDELYQFILDTCIYGTNITVSTPFPGTAYRRELLDNYIALSAKWPEYDGFSLLFDLKHMEKDAFQSKFNELIQKVNSKERFERVVSYFQKLMSERFL